MTNKFLDLNDMVQGYITAALWADCIPADSETNPSWESGGLEHLDVSDSDREYVKRLCVRFYVENYDDVREYLRRMEGYGECSASGQLGYDLRLTSAGHGFGFWDRGLGDLGDRLTEAARATPFNREGSGDVWQVDDTTARIAHFSLAPDTDSDPETGGAD